MTSVILPLGENRNGAGPPGGACGGIEQAPPDRCCGFFCPGCGLRCRDCAAGRRRCEECVPVPRGLGREGGRKGRSKSAAMQGVTPHGGPQIPCQSLWFLCLDTCLKPHMAFALFRLKNVARPRVAICHGSEPPESGAVDLSFCRGPLKSDFQQATLIGWNTLEDLTLACAAGCGDRSAHLPE